MKPQISGMTARYLADSMEHLALLGEKMKWARWIICHRNDVVENIDVAMEECDNLKAALEGLKRARKCDWRDEAEAKGKVVKLAQGNSGHEGQ